MKEVTADSFENDIINSDAQTIVLFMRAPWCSSCKAMAPRLERMAGEHDDFQLFSLNVEKAPQLARRFKVMGVPTFLIFRHGTLVDRKTGEISVERLYKKISAAAGLDAETAKKNEIKGFFRWPFKRKA